MILFYYHPIIKNKNFYKTLKSVIAKKFEINFVRRTNEKMCV